MRRVLGALGGGLLILAATAWPAQAAPPTEVKPQVAENGHIDLLSPKITAGAIDVSTIVDGGATYAAGDLDALIPAEDTDKITVADGVLKGDWFVSGTEATKGTKPFLGVSLTGLAGAGVQGDVTVDLVGAQAPVAGGSFELLTESPATADAADRVLSSDATANLKTFKQTPGTADHKDYFWAFSDKGRYRLSFTVSATTATGTLKSAPITQTFYVGAGAQAAATKTPTTTTVTAAAGATAGQTALTATVAITGLVGSPRGFVEFRDGVTALGTAPVPVQGGVAKAEFPLTEGAHELTAIFYPKYELDYAASPESAPVTYTVPVGGGPQDPDDDPTESPSPTSSPTDDADEDPVDGDCTIIADGDVDYAVRVTGSKAQSGVKDGSSLWLDPAEAVVRVPAAAKTALPDGQGFLGEAGDEAWLLPQTAQSGVPSLGWAAEGTAATWKLTEVDGPGKAVLFATGTDGTPEVLFDGAGDSRQLTAGEHGHGTWGFTAEGVYQLTFTHTTASQGSDEGVLTFAVGAYDEDDLPSCVVASDDDSLADTGAPVLLYGSIGVILVTCGAGLLMGVNRRFGLF
ncbi:surface-anchored protein [Actinocorallia herbida]|uniref:Surface-anchored protein n=1 Tax=Actinocorallia herbida TaxID=58109 RepID=A0A3N1DB06_9ACTN|nr:choice-of-anchor M domain-containing protein [Actinocorallia herbida]ROO90689.1 surface-anchored protein [Actinocorallia herbida]